MAAKMDLTGLKKIREDVAFKKMVIDQKMQLSKELTDDEKKLLEADSIRYKQQLDQIDADISALEDKEQSARDAKHWNKDKVDVTQAIEDNHMGYLIGENKVIYCKNFGTSQSNASFEMVDSTGKKLVYLFEKFCGKKLRGADNERIVDLMADLGKHYVKMTTSFNSDKWNERYVYNQARVIMNFWLQPDLENYESYNKDFDILMHCVGGGKKENIDHLEQWIAYKYCYPDKVANTPNLDIGGNPGGNGKGRYVKLCESIFTPVCVIEAAAKEIMSGFNANWGSAVIIHYDEPEEDELPNSKIKNATGSESQRIEKKGIDAYMADRNYSFVFTSNNENGVVKLAGTKTGEDRRYSVLITNVVMVDYIMELEGCDLETAKSRVNDIAQLVKNNKEVSKWLAHIIIKHDIANMQILPPLHGIDYSNRFEDQKTVLDKSFDSVLAIVMQQRFIDTDLLHEIVLHLTNYQKMSTTAVGRKFESYLKNKKIAHKVIPRQRINYQWHGNDTISKVSARPQRTVISLDDTPTLNFEYSSVSSIEYGKNTMLSKDYFTVRLD